MPKSYERTSSRTVIALHAFVLNGALLRIMLGALLLLAPIQGFSLNLPTLSVTLAWDGSPGSDGIAGYRIHYGTSSRSYSGSISVENATLGSVSGLQIGLTYYFAVTAYDVNGYESEFSEEVTYTPELPTVHVTINLLGKILTFLGVPNRTYDIWANRNSTGWTVIGQVTTQPDGLAVFIDPNLLDFSSTLYYPIEAPSSVRIRSVIDGQILLAVSGQPGREYEIQATQDFTTWEAIGRATMEADGTSHFIDSSAPDYSSRMYLTRDVNY
jgi:hypothetical protein